jgi:hypothetical protein
MQLIQAAKLAYDRLSPGLWGVVVMGRFCLIFFGCLLSTTAIADSAGCWSIHDDAARLACYDKAARPTPAAPATATETPTDSDEATVSTKEVVAAPPLAAAQKVDAADLAIAPNKFLDKNIELNGLQCFYADKDEYRCLSPHSSIILMIVVGDITPAAEKTKLENDCGRIKNLTLPSCRRTLRMVPSEVKHDSVDLRDRTVVMALTAEVVPQSAASNGRRRHY